MNIEEIFDNIIDKSIKISRHWEENNIKSKSIRKEIEYNFFHNKKADFVSKFAYFYALDKRINTRYNNLLKILFRLFQWKKETNLLVKIKQFLKCPSYLDSQSIILQKSSDLFDGKDCFGSDNNTSGLKLQNKNKTSVENKKETCNFEELAKNSDGDTLKNVKQETVLADDVYEVNDTDKQATSKLQYNNINQDGLNVQKEHKNDIYIKQSAPINKNAGAREYIERPKEDLIKSERLQPIKDKSKSNIKSNIKKTPVKFSPNTEGVTIKNTENFDTTVNVFDDNNILSTPHEKLSYNIVDINLDVRQDNHAKTQIDIHVNTNQYPHTKEIFNNIIDEQQKSEIAGEEISKMSEKDIQAIKEIMQEEMYRQMNIAEENGDVYKMPISIKEVISPTTNEISEVQTNKTDNLVLSNKK